MADMNNCSFTGRLTRDAEKKMIPSGTELVTFDLANNTGWGDYAKTMYLSCNLWGKMGTGVFPYLKKGLAVGVIGELEVQQWTSKQDGSKQQKNVLKVNGLTLLGGPKEKDPDAPSIKQHVEESEPVADDAGLDYIPF